MSPVRYPSLARRKQTYRRAEAALNRAVGVVPDATPARVITYAPGLLPTLEGYLHGIIGRDPWRIQCDGCGAIEEPRPLVLMTTRFLPGSDDPRRLCLDCQKEARW